MDFPVYIEEYLLSHEKVFFPGLGTLKIVRKEAGVRKGKFSPPSVSLELTPEVIPDEQNIFPAFISEKENCSREEARQSILELIDEIKFAFNKGEPFILKGICSLSIDDDNNIEVRKDPALVLDPDHFGLESFELEGFDDIRIPGEPKASELYPGRESKKEKIELVLDVDHDMSKFEETYISSPKKEEMLKTPERRETRPVHPPTMEREVEHVDRPSRKRRLWLISLGSGVIIVAALLFFTRRAGIWESGINFNDIFRGNEELEVDDDFSGVKDEEFDFDEMVNKLQKETGTPEEVKDENQKEGNVVTSPADTSVVQGNYVEYHIIAGSFHDYENARELQQQLTLIGYPSTVIDMGNGIFRVSAVSYRDKVTALNELVRFRDKTGMESSWLMNLQ